jgi:hypothetical protein
MAGVEPTTVVYDGDPVLFSLSKNRRRRHMDAVDLDRIAADMATAPHGGACYKIDGSNEPSITDAAKAVGRDGDEADLSSDEIRIAGRRCERRSKGQTKPATRMTRTSPAIT